jgi:hypothetical protein
MNAIHLLKREHEQAKRALAQILEASAGQRGELWAKLQPELKVHEQIEEAALYGPVAQEAGSRSRRCSAGSSTITRKSSNWRRSSGRSAGSSQSMTPGCRRSASSA